jgi:hypothetical protein
MIQRYLVVVVFSIAAAPLAAQTVPPATADAGQHHHEPAADPTALFPARDASGTSWAPDVSPMSGVMRQWRGWSVMAHGNVFGQFIAEPTDRHRTGGDSSYQASSVNWGMVMVRRPLGAGRVGVRAMLSAEQWTVRDCGFLNLLASGEICEADTIHDRQHPHDLFMELAADYDRPLRGSLRWQVYAGFAGEPALGPTAFPHRLSAITNPVAPITHHWLDATHIAFGLVTAGIYDARWKGELSIFNGREPDEHRLGIDLAPLDSVSGRFSVMASDRLVVQVSAGHLEESEEEFPPEPRADVERFTASVTYHRPLGGGLSATTFAYGLNAESEIIPGDEVRLVTHAALLESSLTRGDRHTWFGRFEIAGKPAHDLHVHESPTEVFVVGKLQAGYERSFGAWRSLVPGLGGWAALSIVPSELASRYSGRVSPGFGVFVSLRPRAHDM